jgi:hypothetical protein
MGGQWHSTSRRIHTLYGKGNENHELDTGFLFGPKRDGVTGGWRKLHNEELHNLCSSPSII